MFKHPIKRHLATAALLGLGALMLDSQAASAGPSETNSSASAIETNTPVTAYHPFSLSAELGTAGAGGTFGWRFSDHLGAHASMDYWRQSGDDTIKSLRYGYKLELLSESLALDVYPWERSSFRVSLGFIVNQSELSGHISRGYTLDGTTYSGTLDLSIKPQPVNPYLAIGGNLFYFDRAHHWAMFGELGAAYVGDARVSLTASDSRAAVSVANERHRIQDALNGFPVWPLLKLGVTFSF